MSKVYIVQEPLKKNHNGEWVSAFDLTPASAYGELVFLTKPGNVMLNPGPLIEDLRTKLKGFTDEDYLLFTGSPIAMTAVAAIIADINRGRYKALMWNKQNNTYITINIDIRG